MQPKRLMIARFPFGRSDDPDVTDWVVETAIKAKLDPRISSIANFWVNDTPITMGRNRAVEAAKADGSDFLLMIDSDMSPDAYLATNKNRLDTDSSALPFWDSSFGFMCRRYENGPCAVASPYCGPPPHENVYCFSWATFQSDHPNADLRIEQISREAAIMRSGFEECACLPTGLILMDMRIFDNPLVVPPYFTYEYTDKFEGKKASTEDCVMTRDLNMANIPLFVNWDAWSGHWKRKCVGRPKPIFREQVHQKFIEAATKGLSMKKKLFFVQESDGDAGVYPAGECAVTGADSQPAGSIDISARPSGSGGQRDDSGLGQDGVRVVEFEPGNFSVATEVPRRSAAIGVFGRGAVASHTDRP